MSARITLATALRVLTQLRRDPRTIMLIVAVPILLVTLLKYVFRGSSVFDRIAGPMLGLFPFISMFVVTSITMQRERVGGTLERLMTMPLAKLDLLGGYAAAFAAVAAVQAVAICAWSILVLDLELERSVGIVVGLATANAILGMALGLFASAFARTEFQAVQFMPALVLPQILLCGLFVDRADMARVLELASYALPLTYAYEAIDRVTSPGPLGTAFWTDVAMIGVGVVLALVLAAATLRRRTV
jgi:ABC-2 type transport system permease protein